MEAVTAFNPTVAGRLRLTCQASRLGEIHGTWEMSIGGGTFGSWERPGHNPPHARGDLLAATLRVLREALPKSVGQERLAKAVRQLPNPPTFTDQTLRAALPVWAADPSSGVLSGPTGSGFTTMAEQLAMVPMASTPRHSPPWRPPPQP